MSGLLQTKLKDIKDGGILVLIEELEQACPVGSQDFLELPLLLFLTQCVYPEGPARRVAISTAHVALAPVLDSRVGKLPEGLLRDLCGELAVQAGKTPELFHGNKIQVLLNKTLPKDAMPKSKGARQRRWENVIHRRRSNR